MLRLRDRKKNGAARAAATRALRAPANDRGVTMVEVLVSAVVLAIVVVPVFDGLVGGRVLATRRGEERMALRLIERKMEQLIEAGYGSAGSDADVQSVNMQVGQHPVDPSIVVNTRGDGCPLNDVLGELSWDVTQTTWSSPGDSVRGKYVEVKIVWPASTRRDSVSMVTLVGA